jgi:hypothetical protein
MKVKVVSNPVADKVNEDVRDNPKLAKYTKNVRLTPRQYKFVALWLDPTNKETYANAYQSALAAGFSPSYSRILTSNALNLEWVAEAKKQLAVYEPEHIYRAFQDIATSSRQDRDKLKALELMGKSRGMFVDRVQSDVQVTFVNDVPRPRSEIIDVDAS